VTHGERFNGRLGATLQAIASPGAGPKLVFGRGDEGRQPLGYRLVHGKTGAKALGYGPQGPVTLDNVEAFLTKSR
jgi:hypothetical protein